MPHSKPPRISWPRIQEPYLDEVGPVDPNVYALGGEVWPLAEPMIARTTKDPDSAQRLMMKAIAKVSRVCEEKSEPITNIKAYLLITFRRLLMEEFLKQTGHAERNAQIEIGGSFERSESDIAKTILVHEILERADAWTREVLELMVLGHSFSEIAKIYGMESNHVRSNWHKRMNKLKKQIRRETQAAERKIWGKRR